MRGKNRDKVVHGWVALDKPLGMTSTQAIGRVRRLVGGSKVGHGGTLDPLATGVLPLAFGEATKLIPYVMDGDKVYEFSIKWGEFRSTDDAEGSVIARSDVRPSEKDIVSALPSFVGRIMQKPPAFSAIKVQGERAYDLARSGEIVDLAAREVRIDDFQLIEVVDKDTASFRVSSGKGMYVRSLARDLAVKLGACGHVCRLRRTKSGPFSLENACTIENLEALLAKNEAKTAVLPIKSGLGDVPALNLTQAEADNLRMGRGVIIRPQHLSFCDYPIVFAEYLGEPVAVVEVRGGEFKVLRGFHF